MKLLLCLGFVVFLFANGIARADTIIDSAQATTEKSLSDTSSVNNRIVDNDISYPPKEPETKISDIVKAAKGLRDEIHSLDTAMVNDVKRDGLIPSLREHRKFYLSIAVFVVLFLIWLKTRDKF